MGLFDRFKSSKPEDDKAKAAKPAAGSLDFNPAKANSWFVHARNAQETGNIEYAITCWLSGMRFDPGNIGALEDFFKCAAQYRGESASKAPTKDMVKALAGSTSVDKFLLSLLNWACKPNDGDLALKAAMSPAEIGLEGPAKWIGPKALELLARDPKPKKDHFIRLMEAMAKFKLYDVALRAGEIALKLDPTDIGLGTDVKNMAAQATMSKGGYENTGDAGAFRGNLRDADKQKRMEEEGRVVRGADAATNMVEATKAEYLGAIQDRALIRKYIEALLNRQAPGDEQAAIAVLDKAFKDTQEYRFRQMGGDLKIKLGRRELKPLREAADAGDEATKAKYEAAVAKQLELEISEYSSRVQAYPTDLIVKYELALRYIEVGRHNEAIEQLQLAKSDGRNKMRVLLAMGRSFVAIGWADEAVDTFRQALEGQADLEPGTLDLRYELMCALQMRAEKDRDVAAAEEASAIASKIAQQQFGYKDIRQRREAIKALITQLKS